MPEDVTVGVLTPMLGGFYFGGILTGIEEACRDAGGRVVAVQTFDPGLPDNAYQETTDFRHPVAWRHLTGLVIILNAVGDEYLTAIRRAGIPTVTISQEYPELHTCNVLSDNRSGVRSAVDHLLGHGHRDIAFVGHLAQPDIEERYLGYTEALRANGLTTRLYQVGDNLFGGGREAGHALLRDGLPSTAVIAATDFNAIGLMDVVTGAGRRIPHDLAVVGFDDTAEATLARPTLASVRQEFGDLGRQAVKVLLTRVRGGSTPHQVQLPTALVPRESCGCAREAASLPAAGRRRGVASRSHVRELLRDNTLFKELLKAQYKVSVDLLLSHLDDPRELHWLRSTSSLAGLLGLWSTARHPLEQPPRLNLAGRYDLDDSNSEESNNHESKRDESKRDEPKRDESDTHESSSEQGNDAVPVAPAAPNSVAVDEFPPLDFLDLTTQRPGNVVSVVPVKMRTSDWGLLAIVGPIEDRLSVSRATTNQWAALLSVALDREAVLHSLRRQEESLRRAALYDPLTGLPNRVLFADRVRDAIEATHADPRRRFAVLFLDLDGFKVINDSLGHLVGDQLLTQVADRIAGSVRHTDMAARLGGDEFAVLVDDISGSHTAEAATERLQQTFAQPFDLNGQDVVVSASIGIAQSTDRYVDAQEVLRDADIAMYRAKTQAKGSHANFDVGMRALAVRRLQTEADLRRAVEREEFELHYQPIVELTSGRIASCEALIRWRRPDGELIRPSDFIEVAEEVGLTAPIGRWTISTAAQQVRAWSDAGLVPEDFRVKVNISHKQFWQTDLVGDVMERLSAANLPARRFTLEITESVIMQRVDAARQIMRELHDKGLRLAIDDFGTGYSSLSALLQLPIDTLKIDQSFVYQLVLDQRSRELVRSIVRMGRSLGLLVIAEGVETTAQRAHLVQLGCPQGQGYLFAQPLPAERATELLRNSAQSGPAPPDWPYVSTVDDDPTPPSQ